MGYTQICVICTDELQAWSKPHRKKSEPMKLSEMSWMKSRGKTSKIKCKAGEYQDSRALTERGHVTARLHARFEDLESKHNRLFLVTSNPLHAACERKARLQRQRQKQEEWRTAHLGTVLGSTESSMEGVHDGSVHELTPIPYDCEWMDTEGGDLLWYEEHVVVDKAKATEVFDCTIHQSLSPLWYNERA